MWFTGVTQKNDGSLILATHKRSIVGYGAYEDGNQSIVSRDSILWMTRRHAESIDRYDPSTHLVKKFGLPAGYALPLGLALGSDHQLWFTNQDLQGSSSIAIGKLCPQLHAAQCATAP
jgi:streptogramin lyase